MYIRRLRKFTVAVLTVALMLTSMTTVFAADPSPTVANADKAVTLKDLGLYAGQDANDPKIGLENALTTQDSLIFLSKLFGYNEAANALTDDQVAERLAKFDDAASVSDYAKKVVAYSATNNILSGSTRDGKLFVGAKDTATAERFATFMLRQMGYSVADYRKSVAQLAETNGSNVDATLTGDLTRDAAVGVMFGALTAEKASGKTVIADIVGDNDGLRAKAEKAGLITAPDTKSSGGGSEGIRSVSVNKNESIKIKFNEELDIEVATSPDSYEVKRLSDNKEIPLTPVIDDSRSSVELKFNSKLIDNTEYQLLIKHYKDIYGNKNKSEFKYTFITGDNTAPEVNDKEDSDERCYVIAEKGLIFIIFSEPMIESQMLDKTNYMVSIDGNAYFDLDDDDKLTKVNNRKIQMYVKELEGKKDSNINVKVAPIMDLANKRLYGKVDAYIVKFINPDNVYIKEAQLIAKNKIKIVFNKEMEQFNMNDIVLTNLTTPSAINIVDSGDLRTEDGKSEVDLYLDKELATDVTDEGGARVGISTIASPSSVSVSGGKLMANYDKAPLDDKVAPEFVKILVHGDIASPDVYGSDYIVPEGTTGSITIYFSEDIKQSSLSKDTFYVDGFTITGILAPSGTKTVVLTVEANADDTSVNTTVTQESPIEDVADNALAKGWEWIVTFRED